MFSGSTHKWTTFSKSDLSTLLVLAFHNAHILQIICSWKLLVTSSINLPNHLEVWQPDFPILWDFWRLLPQQSLCHPWVIWGKFLRIALISLQTAYSSWVRLVIPIPVKTSITCSRFYTLFLLKKKMTMKLHIYFRHFYLKLGYSSYFFAHIPKSLSRE